jgi:hypothetical protein
MEPEAFLNSLTPVYEFIYNNESELEPLQYPLAFSRFKIPRFANELYSDNTSQYFTYSGVDNSIIVTREKEGRYKNLTLKAYSGDSFKFYFQSGSGALDGDMYFSGPLTVSGAYNKLTQYTTKSGALSNAITFTSPTDNSSVYVLPNILSTNWVRLYHESVDGVTPYRIYQFLPRTFIQVDDLEADVIDAVTVRVSGSIVVTADNLAAGSITGDKIMAGTVSGVLITPGTITANEISGATITGDKIVARTISGALITAGTIKGENIEALTISGALIAAGTITATNIAVSGITADRLNVAQLDAVAANMGNLVVNSGVSIGTNGTLWAGAGSATSPTTGLKIYTTGGNTRLTTYSGGVAQIDVGSDGKFYAGSGQTLRLDDTGIRFKTSAISGEPLFAGGRVDPDIVNSVIPPPQNMIKFHPYNYTVSYPDTIFTEDLTDSTLFFIENSEIYNSLGIDENAYLGSYARLRSGWRPTESGTSPMYKKTIDSVIDIESYSSSVSTISLNAHGYSSTKIQLVGAPPLGQGGVYITGKTSISGAVVTSGNIQTNGALITASGLSSNGSAFSLTTPRINYAENSGKPTLVITGSGVSGTSGSISLENSSVVTAGQKQGYINMDSNNTLEVTNQVTNGNMHLNLPNNGNFRVYVNSPATAQLAVSSTGATITGTVDVTGQTTMAALNASGAIGFGTSYNKFTVAAATGNTAVAGTLTSTGKFTASDLAYGTFTRTADLAITTAGTTITWQASVHSPNNVSYSTTDITVTNAGYYLITGYFATAGNVSLRMTLQRSTANHTSIQQVTPLSTGGGYLFNFSNALWLTANTVLKVVLTPSANTTLNQNGETGAAPSPFLHIIQLAGI